MQENAFVLNPYFKEYLGLKVSKRKSISTKFGCDRKFDKYPPFYIVFLVPLFRCTTNF